MTVQEAPANQAATYDVELLEKIAAKVGTPFWLYDAAVLRKRIADITKITASEGLQARYAMKSCPATRILREMLANDIWIDAVSANEVLRALRAGYKSGNNPPYILYTADVFRDLGVGVVRDYNIMPNIGSPGMLQDLKSIGYNGPIVMRVNPGFGHGHVNACDTGGPSSKHGIWFSHAVDVAKSAAKLGMKTVMLHAHVGSGPKIEELLRNLRRVAEEFAKIAPEFPDLEGVSLGGGIPHHYRENEPQIEIDRVGALLREARAILCDAVGRPVRLEIEPGRYFVAPSCSVVTRVADVKKTETNSKGDGARFVMVDAGFVDLIRPAMYGSYHRISMPGKGEDCEKANLVVAGPLCESGDVFTRDSSELIAPRQLPVPAKGDLVMLHDAGAYGYAMSSNYNSVGRAPQVWLEEDGSITQISRRETVEDLLRIETEEKL